MAPGLAKAECSYCMTVFQKIKAAFTLKKVYDEMKRGATTMEGTKPGWKTTEFYLVLLGTTIPTLIGAANGMIPPKWAAIILAASSAVYGIIRAITKATAAPVQTGDTNVTVKTS